MNSQEIQKLKFPIGKFDKPPRITKEILSCWINEISNFPELLSEEVIHLTDEQLETQYRPNGWSIKQIVHHCADSHMNNFIRLKLTLTEDQPTIKPYFEKRWAELIDSKSMPIQSSLKIIEGVHEKWTCLLNNITNNQLNRKYVHPEHGMIFKIKENIGLYAWHCKHHLAHVIEAKNKFKKS